MNRLIRWGTSVIAVLVLVACTDNPDVQEPATENIPEMVTTVNDSVKAPAKNSAQDWTKRVNYSEKLRRHIESDSFVTPKWPRSKNLSFVRPYNMDEYTKEKNGLTLSEGLIVGQNLPSNVTSVLIYLDQPFVSDGKEYGLYISKSLTVRYQLVEWTQQISGMIGPASYVAIGSDN